MSTTMIVEKEGQMENTKTTEQSQDALSKVVHAQLERNLTVLAEYVARQPDPAACFDTLMGHSAEAEATVKEQKPGKAEVFVNASRNAAKGLLAEVVRVLILRDRGEAARSMLAKGIERLGLALGLLLLVAVGACSTGQIEGESAPRAVTLQAGQVVVTKAGKTIESVIRDPKGNVVGNTAMSLASDGSYRMVVTTPDGARSTTLHDGKSGRDVGHWGDTIKLAAMCGDSPCTGAVSWRQELPPAPSTAPPPGIYPQAQVLSSPGVIRPVGGGGSLGLGGDPSVCTANLLPCIEICEEVFWTNPIAESVCIAGCETEVWICRA